MNWPLVGLHAILGFVAGCAICMNAFEGLRHDYVKAGVMIVDARAYRVSPLVISGGGQ